MYNYLVGFSVYTLAMIGIVLLGFVVVKKCSIARSGAKSHNNFLEMETSLSIEPRKTIHVIRAGRERLLIATDAENTRFLTKLDSQAGADLDAFAEDCFAGELINKSTYCTKDTQENIFPKDVSFLSEEEEQPKVFKDLMKRLQK